jgi:chaperonin GroEL (HSP60 family)
MRQVKQEALAFDLGDDWNQKKVSLLEQKETIEPAILQQISKILDIPVEAFQNMDDDQVVNIVSNTFTSNDTSTIDASYAGNSSPTFYINPLEEIQKLHEEKIVLFERMLKEKDEMMARLEKLITKNSN